MKHRKRVLDSDFYKNRYKKIINLAGPRYSPETNIDLPLSDIFHSLCRTKEFYNEIRKMTGLILKGMKYDRTIGMMRISISGTNFLPRRFVNYMRELVISRTIRPK